MSAGGSTAHVSHTRATTRSRSPPDATHPRPRPGTGDLPSQPPAPPPPPPPPFRFLQQQNTKLAQPAMSYHAQQPSGGEPQSPGTPTTPGNGIQHPQHFYQIQGQPMPAYPQQQYYPHYAKMPLSSPHGYSAPQPGAPPQPPALHIPSAVYAHAQQGPHSSPASASLPPPTAQQRGNGVKRKRKSTADASQRDKQLEEDEDAAQSGSQSQPSLADPGKKRTKTQRACDSCRTRKIRCDVIADTEPALCQHCKQYGFECTFFLPITETRFKKKRLEEETAVSFHATKPESQDRRFIPMDGQTPSRSTASPRSEIPKDAKIYGPTFLPFLVQSTSTVPKGHFDTYDLRHLHTWEVSNTGDGFIQVFDPNSEPENKHPLPAPVDLRINRDMLEKLVNMYFDHIAPIFPVVSRGDFTSGGHPPTLLLYAISIVAATQRDIPQAVFDALRQAVNKHIRDDDILSSGCTTNVQTLLVLGMCGDAHSSYVPLALSALWQRVGAAIRMAQDLGLHRAEAYKKKFELRRRVWGACVISDRWCSLTYGHPFMIDVSDCDARLPSAADSEHPLAPGEYVYMNELIKLSILLGRVLKMIYSPSGLITATDEGLQALLVDLDVWKARLPPSLTFQGEDTGIHGGLLHLLYSCVLMIFWRVFMRISYTVPVHLKFSLTVERWTALVLMTRESIDWLDRHERIYDTWMLVSYAATSCALVQYHTWARRRDPDAQASLLKLRDCVKRWEDAVPPDHMSTRRRTTEVISLLYNATLHPDKQRQAPYVNPTKGVAARTPDALRGLTFRKDPSRPGGGVYIADERSHVVHDNPDGTFVVRGEPEEQQTGQPGNAQGQMEMQQQHQQQSGLPQGPTSAANVNPHLNEPVGTQPSVQVLNMLDAREDGVPTSADFLTLPEGIDWESLDRLDTIFSTTAAFDFWGSGQNQGDGMVVAGAAAETPSVTGQAPPVHPQQLQQQLFQPHGGMAPSGIMGTMGGAYVTPALYPAHPQVDGAEPPPPQ
ncbi:hypothetical protein AURDEDRAFT_115195 [Auricularia subglabra TFB-10046 SS5]|nr:hypothetical protein AURDEDRAFT_115195 [Auricularia subglabra TFB-10046 SS5]